MIAEIEPVVQSKGFKANADDEPFFEIIDGQRVELSPMSILASRVTSNIQTYLGNHLLSNPVGQAVTETLFRLPLPVDRNRRPDVAFVSNKAIAETNSQAGSDNAWAVLPELMVEVVSPSDIAEDIIDRINEYFEAGTKLVWIVYPTQRLVYIYDSPSQVRVLRESDELDGGIVMPSFRVSIATLFPVLS